MSAGWDFYYAPEKFGLEPVAEYDLYAEPYEFTLVAVWREKETGKLWGAHDSGCSCPVPFENHTWPTDFTEIRSEADLRGLIEAAASEYRNRRESEVDFVRAVAEAATAA